MFRRVGFKTIALLTLVLLVGLAAVGCSAVAELGPMADTGEAFMNALKTGNNTASFNLLTADVQKEVGGAEGWAKWTQPRVPTKWDFSSKVIENGVGKLDGSVSFANGQNLKVNLVLNKVGSDWKLAGVTFQ